MQCAFACLSGRKSVCYGIADVIAADLMGILMVTDAAKRERPVGICARCHKPVRSFDLIGKKCEKPLPYGKKCPGVIRTAIRSQEWSECPSCLGTGLIDGVPCPHCDGEGWTYANR
jgi:DnaJ-class molecular chaperone